MAQHDALGFAGGAAGIEDGGKFLRVAAGGRQPVTPLASSRQRRDFVQRVARRGYIRVVQRIEPRLCADKQPCTAVGQNMGHLRPLEQRVDRNMHQPRTRGGERQQTGQFALC